MVKRCFICGAKQDDTGNCTNSNCPRYVVKITNTAAISSETTESISTEKTEEKTNA